MTGRLDSEVIIIGGGATGAGIVRDCARRGLRTLLIERHDLCLYIHIRPSRRPTLRRGCRRLAGTAKKK